MQFDYVVGNPPYQKPANIITDEHKRAGGLWWSFVQKSLEVVKSDGYVAIVCPSSLFGAGGYSTGTKLQKLLGQSRITHLWPNVNQYFTVGINILTFICKKTTDTLSTEIVNDNLQIEFDIRVPAPYHFSSQGYGIIAKTWQGENPRIDFVAAPTPKPDDAVLRVNGGRFKSWSKMFAGYQRDTVNNQQGGIIDENDVPGFQSALKSDLWEYLFLVMGAADGQSPGYIKYFPVMSDMTRSYSNDEWYEAFNITEAEQQHIREYLKR